MTTALSTSSANAASLTIPTTTVNGTDVFSGPSFTVNNDFLGTDTISLNVSGTVNLTNTVPTGSGYITNAAGILTQPTASFGSQPTGAFVVRAPGINWGALLLGNSTLGFRQLFTANTANGLGSSTPSTNLSLTNVTLASIFGTGLTNGTVLEFRISDSDNFNNSGAFTVSSPTTLPTTTAVPEPFTIIGTLIGGAAAVRMRKKLKSDTI
ncbi:PEP-CTERM sorting domain-containing protein [Chamaesiphon polymorphus CCALA 037]|uniref:PEP-CTERM sorting domain-containing protein n=2 Tax=Chamaesiphon TaxID=217161 RepID=A0A2T1G3W5_9CYAN|nr:PEP-CTERM sorting domain-containing protein [Chamaesiphon polymorphus CCALA 037]